MAAARQYSAFISYSHQDERWARWLQRVIERYRVPGRLRGSEGVHGPVPDHLRPVFRDREELASASDLGDSVRGRLDASRFLIILCSPTAARSRWVNEEILHFKRRGGAARILSLIVSGEPHSGDTQECFPEALRFELDANGHLGDVPTEPIAADLRPGKDGKALARLKILAGMLGVGLDDLRRREQQRKYRVFAALTAASVAGMVFTAWLAWTAMIARDDAQRRQAQAEDLIEFMLGDLHEELQQVGRIDALSAAATKAQDYFANLSPRDMSDAALRSSGKAMRQVGHIHNTQFQYEQALAAFEAALALDRELLARAPDDPDLLFNLGQSEFWVGNVAFERNDYALATEHMTRYLGISQALYERDAANVDWVMELCYAHTNLAAVSEARADVADALAHMHRAVALNREAIALAPGDTFLLRELSDSLAWLGTIQRTAGQLQASLASRQDSREVLETLLEANPEDATLQDLAAYAWRGEAYALSLVGRADEAIAAYREALRRFDQLVNLDPSNVRWPRDRLQSTASLLEAAASADHGALAEDEWLLETLESLPPSATHDLGSPVRQLALAHARAVAAQRNASRFPDRSAAQMATALREAEAVQENNPGNFETELHHAGVLLYVAGSNVNLNQERVRAVAETLFERSRGSSDPLLLSTTIRYALRLGRDDVLAALDERLRETGYRSARLDRELSMEAMGPE